MAETIEAINTRLCYRWYHEVWNERREATIDELFSRNVLVYGVTDETLGFDGFKAAWRGVLETVGDLQLSIEQTVAEGDVVAVRLTIGGIHVGPGFGVAASGRPLAFSATVFTTWKDGQIVEGWNLLDMAAAYRQIGAQVV